MASSDGIDGTIGARFDDATIARIDLHLTRLDEQAPRGARRLTRSDALRNLVERGLADAERRAGPQRGDGSGSKTKREA